MRIPTRILIALSAAGFIAVTVGLPAGAGTITTPSGSPQHPFAVPHDSHDAPVPFTISGSGWPEGQPVYIEQCDAVPPTQQGWDPTLDCDTGTSPAAAIPDAHGNVTFLATSRNYAFPVFRGASPQGLFNCLSPHQPDPKNGLQSFRTCQVKMSSSNTNATADQAFITITLPDSSQGYPLTSQATQPGAVPLPATPGVVPGSSGTESNGAGSNGAGSNGAGSNGSGANSSTSNGGHSGADNASAATHDSNSSSGFLASTGADILFGVVLGLLLIVIGWLIARRRRHERLA